MYQGKNQWAWRYVNGKFTNWKEKKRWGDNSQELKENQKAKLQYKKAKKERKEAKGKNSLPGNENKNYPGILIKNYASKKTVGWGWGYSSVAEKKKTVAWNT